MSGDGDGKNVRQTSRGAEKQLPLFGPAEASNSSPPRAASQVGRSPQVKLVDVVTGFKRKFDEIAEKKKRASADGSGGKKSVEPLAKQKKPNGHCGGANDSDVDMDRDEGVEEESEEVDEEEVEEEDVDGTGKVNTGGGSSKGGAKKRKQSSRLGATASMRRLVNMEDRTPLCLLGETESNMFPKTVELMNHTVPVIYDSRVHVWFKADDFAKALGYKNYKSSVEKYVDPKFVLLYPNVLDLSRARYGDAFRLYAVNNKTAFINEAGAVQLLFRWLISGHSRQQQQQQPPSLQIQQQQQQTVTTATTTNPIIGEQSATESSGEITPVTTVVNTEKSVKSPVIKPKLSADWIDYQLRPALHAFSDAAMYGKTAREWRYENKYL